MPMTINTNVMVSDVMYHVQVLHTIQFNLNLLIAL